MLIQPRKNFSLSEKNNFLSVIPIEQYQNHSLLLLIRNCTVYFILSYYHENYKNTSNYY